MNPFFVVCVLSLSLLYCFVSSLPPCDHLLEKGWLKLKARDFNATSLSTYVFSTLYTTLTHNLNKDKRIDLIERTFNREGTPYLACNDINAFYFGKT